jgi:antirestriction protein
MDLMDTAQLLGNFGEFVGAIAVVVTLVYLALQIRQNNKNLSANIYTAWVDTGAIVHSIRADHPDVFLKAFSVDGNPEDLTAQEAQIAESVCAQMFNLFEANYLHYVEGAIKASVFDAKRRNMLWRMQLPYVRQMWEKIGEHVYDRRFIDYVNNEILGSGSSTA